MKRLQALDWLLIGTLVPIWLACVGLTVWDGLAHTQHAVAVLAKPGGPDQWPTVMRLRAAGLPVRVGDRLIAVGQHDLRGVSFIGFQALANAVGHSDPDPQLVIERDGERRTVPLPLTEYLFSWWAALPFSVGVGVTALLVLLRSPAWRLTRRFFAGALCWSIAAASSFITAGGDWTYLGYACRFVPVPFFMAITLWNAFEWTDAALPLRPWQRLLPWLLGGATAVVYALGFLTSMGGPSTLATGGALVVAFSVGVIYAYARAYRRSDAGERRRIKWVVYGFAVGTSAFGIAAASNAVWHPGDLQVVWNVTVLAALAVPVGFLVSILGYQYLDIDRLISGTAATAILAAVLAAGVFALIPPAAQAAGDALNAEPGTVQLVLSMALAGLLVPGYQLLHGRIEQRLFPQRQALEQGFDRLLDELAGCRDTRELTSTAGERLDALLGPESIVTYAREGDAFTPVFARGRALPPAFDATTMLVSALDAHTAPLAAERFVRGGTAPLSPFDRAALETLDVAVISPTHRGGNLVAFQCLGPKRSGDIYTATDLALLAAVSSKVADRLARFDDEAVLHDAREMQAALRRYVPGAVADELAKGTELPSGEREVTVLFVDIRGYVRLAEGLHAEEVFSTLNRHTEEVSKIVGGHGGAIVEFNGDGMMAVFGAPRALDEKESCAVAAAREIVTSLEGREIAVGIGIATGQAYVGDIQSVDRSIWSVVGNTTNLAARLQGLTRDLDAAIAIDALTRQRAGAACAGFLAHPGRRIRGRSEPLDIFALPLRRERDATAVSA